SASAWKLVIVHITVPQGIPVVQVRLAPTGRIRVLSRCELPLLVTGDAASVSVMNEYRCSPRQYIVRVVVGDGEVVDALVLGGLVFGGGDLDVGAGAGAEPHAGLEVGGLHPLADVAGDPEGV